MSDTDLRRLLHERVADVAAPDLAAAAWARGRRERRRRGALAVAGTALATAAVVVGIAVADPTPSGLLAPAGDPAGPPTSTVQEPPDASYRGTPVWFSPDQVAERRLPAVEDGPLPEVVDLDTRAEALAGPAVAAFGAGRRVLLVDRDGHVVAVDVSRLDRVTKPNGYRLSPLTHEMLSPNGRYLMFPQDETVEVYDIQTRHWSSLDSMGQQTIGAAWVRDDTIGLPRVDSSAAGLFAGSYGGAYLTLLSVAVLDPPFRTGQAQAYGGTRSLGSSAAQAWGMGVDVPMREGGVGQPEFVVAEVRGQDAVLSVTWPVGDGSDSRFKQCCPVAGWLDAGTLVYESRQTEPTLVAWTVGTDDFRRLATVDGRYLVASFADLSR